MCGADAGISDRAWLTRLKIFPALLTVVYGSDSSSNGTTLLLTNRDSESPSHLLRFRAQRGHGVWGLAPRHSPVDQIHDTYYALGVTHEPRSSRTIKIGQESTPPHSPGHLVNMSGALAEPCRHPPCLNTWRKRSDHHSRKDSSEIPVRR